MNQIFNCQLPDFLQLIRNISPFLSGMLLIVFIALYISRISEKQGFWDRALIYLFSGFIVFLLIFLFLPLIYKFFGGTC